MTDGEYTDLLSSVPKGSEIVSNDEYDKFAMRRSPTGLLKMRILKVMVGKVSRQIVL